MTLISRAVENGFFLCVSVSVVFACFFLMLFLTSNVTNGGEAEPGMVDVSI